MQAAAVGDEQNGGGEHEAQGWEAPAERHHVDASRPLVANVFPMGFYIKVYCWSSC